MPTLETDTKGKETEQTGAPAIEIKGLEKRYGNSSTALNGVDLTVEQGQAFGLLGPNGAGKTSLIDILLDYVRPTAGSGSIFGDDTQSDTVSVRQRTGILPEQYELYPRLTGYRHLEFAMDSQDVDGDPDGILRRVGLDHEDGRSAVGTYSAGMRQRLVLGMSLVDDPDLLILDEPSKGLDPHGTRQMASIIKDAVEHGMTVFFSSHRLEIAEKVCDEVAILVDGRIVASGPIDELHRESESTSIVEMEVNRVPDGDLTDLEGVTMTSTADNTISAACDDPDVKADVIGRVHDTDVHIKNVRIEDPTLYQLFENYTEPEEER